MLADVRPFTGIRYDSARVGRLDTVLCEPYDVISPSAQRTYLDADPRNYIRVELGEDETGDTPSRNRYTRARAALEQWLASAEMVIDPSPAFYVLSESYTLAGQSRTRIGLFAAVGLRDWSERVILPHEHTMPKPKADRLSLMQACEANTSPILTTYSDPQGELRAILEEAITTASPVAEATKLPAMLSAADDHRLWRIDEPTAIERISTFFRGRVLYIADGHHRYETALGYWRSRQAAGAEDDDPASCVLMLLVDVDDPGLAVFPTHRLLRTVARVDEYALCASLGHWIEVTTLPAAVEVDTALAELAAVRGRHAFTVLTSDATYILRSREGADLRSAMPEGHSDAWYGLDVSVLHEVVLPRAFLLPDDAASLGEIAFTRDAAEAAEAVSSGRYAAAVLMRPTQVGQVTEIALAGDVMPQKSTYFWPKPLSGLVIYPHRGLAETAQRIRRSC